MYSTCTHTYVLPAENSFVVMYSDRVLKCLPDIKILISLHQQLSGGVASGCCLVDKLESSDQLRNAGTTKGEIAKFKLDILKITITKGALDDTQ